MVPATCTYSFPALSVGDRLRATRSAMARLAHETGLFPVFEAEYGEVTAVSPIRHRMPVESYLSIQSRYAHLFGEGGRPDIVARVQAMADHNISRYGLLEMPSSDGGPMETSS